MNAFASNVIVPQLIAHRGNAFEFPENTLPSLRSALSLGAPYIEFDVQLSADLVPMVMHDANLQRCAGIDRDALTMTAAELRATSVGEARRFDGKFADVCVPSLIDVAALLKEFPHAKAFVELKRASLRKFGMELMVEKVRDALRPVMKQVIVISFDLTAISWARHVMRTPVGWVLPDYNTQNAIKAEATLPNFLLCDVDRLPAGTRRLWRGPWNWAFYEITSGAQAAALQALGVPLLETMQVQHMLHELAALSNQDSTQSKPTALT